jgi:hypothetical protein
MCTQLKPRAATLDPYPSAAPGHRPSLQHGVRGALKRTGWSAGAQGGAQERCGARVHKQLLIFHVLGSAWRVC